MRLSDLLHPERVFKLVGKMFLGIFILLIVASLVLGALQRMHVSLADVLAMLLGCGFLSFIAYLVRERRIGRRPASRGARGAERRPVLEGEE